MVRFVCVSGSEFSAFCSQVNALRLLVWQTEGAQFKGTQLDNIMIDDLDGNPNTHHFLYFKDQELVGAIRMYMCSDAYRTGEDDDEAAEHLAQMPGPYAAFSRQVVHPGHRGLDLGAKLIRACIFKSYEFNAGTACLSSVGEDRISYWERLGFKLVSRVETTVTDTYEIDVPVFGFIAPPSSLVPAIDRRQRERKIAS